MRLTQTIVALVVCAFAVRAQTSGDAVARARQDIDRIRPLVDAGALPKKALADAQASLEEALDRQTLGATLYGQVSAEDLTEQQADDMLAAAQRYVSRQQAKVDDAQKLVDAGVVGKATLDPVVEELESRRRIYEEASQRASLLKEIAGMIHAEAEVADKADEESLEAHGLTEHYDGDGILRDSQLKATVLAFEKEFGKPLPISARGETALHRSLGFDHRGRVDVALTPDSKEGLWLRRYLESEHVPYFAFRAAVPGKATAAHIHIGPQSVRVRRAD